MKHLKLIVWLVVGSLIAWAFVVRFIGSSGSVDGTSMLPNYTPNEVIFVNRIGLLWHTPVKGDVVLIHNPQDNGTNIKRIAAVPHETIAYVAYNKTNTITLGDNQYFLLGDNPSISYDSRFYGPLDRSQIFGLVTIIK